jgi:hypothetical protein
LVGYKAQRRRKPHGFQAFATPLIAKSAISFQGTAKWLRSAVSARSTGQQARFSHAFVHLFAISAAKSIAFMSPDPAPDRHLAMMFGEQEPDYVLLAGKDSVDGTLVWTTPEADLVTWWAELFEVPSVAFCHTTDEAHCHGGSGRRLHRLWRCLCAQPDAAAQLVGLADQLTALAAQETPES